MTRVIGRFHGPADLVRATRDARALGFKYLEAFTPFPVPAVSEALGFHERWIPPIALVAALVAAGCTVFMQWYSAVISYPFVIGGKPYASWWPFVLPTVALTILAAVIAAFVTMLRANRLPHPYHPAFDWPAFDRASSDGFFLLIEDETGERARHFLQARAIESRELEDESGDSS